MIKSYPAHPKDSQWGSALHSVMADPYVKVMSHAFWITHSQRWILLFPWGHAIREHKIHWWSFSIFRVQQYGVIWLLKYAKWPSMDYDMAIFQVNATDIVSKWFREHETSFSHMEPRSESSECAGENSTVVQISHGWYISLECRKINKINVTTLIEYQHVWC